MDEERLRELAESENEDIQDLVEYVAYLQDRIEVTEAHYKAELRKVEAANRRLAQALEEVSDA